ncbi:MBG domain-containing protein [Marinilabilia salmonicolor]|uniref:Putative secreted protein (Por secretion system target) n=1 Tax=Marinilabilia salmonicolor TaxID=989 RepID=A0A368V8B9_9BACT|nr:MBG domain-containing protein [Marinilabilia salmonicolor]RCW37447.1 putative secreted protein (Por secretion system target) [Marinilabilia salmonicolor]
MRKFLLLVFAFFITGYASSQSRSLPVKAKNLSVIYSAPVIDAGQILSVLEEAPASTIVGLVTAFDDAGGEAPAFSIQSGNEDGFFALDAATGELTLVKEGLNRYDYESFSLLVRATDQNDAQLFAEETVVVNVDEIPFSGGAGTEADPFLIKTPKDLDEIRNYLGSSHADKYFELVNDIDLQEYLSEGNPGYNNGLFWERLGYYEYFEGHLNGNSFSVLNLKINRPNDYINGLFGYVSSAEINNLNVSVDPLAEIVGLSSTAILAGSVSNGSIISNVHVSGKVNAQPGNVGGLAGSFAYGAVISDCSATVEVVSTGNFVGGLIGVNNGTILRCHVEGDITGGRFVGGIAGYNNEEPVAGVRGLIQQCSVEANSVVTATTGECGGLVGQNTGDVTRCSSFATVNAPVNAGGLVGNNEEVEADMMMVFENYAGRINNSYASGMVTATDGAAGGLVGQNTGDIENCYALGEVNAPLIAGGLVGENLELAEENTEGGLITGNITNCYSATSVNGSDATIGGFAGVNDGNITSSYWDINASGQEISAGGTGLNGIAMREAASFADWDFTNVWGIDALEEYVSYPYLLDNEENPHPGAIGKVTVTSWPTASDIVYGQVVGESVLSGGAATHEGSPVAGTFNFLFGTDMHVVGATLEEVAFIPDNADSYLPVIDGTTLVNVLPKPVSVVNAVAQDKIYDGTTVAVVSDAVLEDNAVEGGDDVLLSNHTSGTFAQAGAGDGISVTTNMTLTGADATNYALEQPVLTASISKASLTVTADDQTRLYGEVNPKLTFGYSGFVNGEDASVLATLPSVSTLADAGSNVSDYAITVGDGSDENYDFSYVDGVLAVNPAPLTVKAKDATRIVGAPNPEFEFEYTGFVNGEDQSVIDFLPGASCEADEFSEPGDYPIIVSPGDDGNYYFIVDNSGVLTVTTATSILQEFNGEKNVYPVPADTYLFVSGIHIVSVSDVEVVDMSGRTIKTPYSETDTGSLRVDVSSLKSGIYFLKIRMNERMILEKIVVL